MHVFAVFDLTYKAFFHFQHYFINFNYKMEDEDLPPPLEDMSQEIAQRKKNKM